MISNALGSAALSLETSGLLTVWLGESSDWTLAMFLLQHGAASALLALLLWAFLAPKFGRSRLPILALLFSLSFFIPVLGPLGILAAAIYFLVYRRRIGASMPFASLSLPEFVLSIHETEAKFGQGGIKSRLAQPSIPTAQRLQALLALQGMPTRVSSPMLQDMLGDSSDDIRLVAYGLLDSREKKINAQIHHELTKLKFQHSGDLRLISLRHLAELYWELVYSELAQGDLRAHALRQALKYANDALLLAPMDTGLWFLKGRILHEMKLYADAYQILGLAITHGLPEVRVLPYIIEIAFYRNDYKTVRDLLRRISTDQVTPRMRSAIRFWVGELNEEGTPSAKGGAA